MLFAGGSECSLPFIFRTFYIHHRHRRRKSCSRTLIPHIFHFQTDTCLKYKSQDGVLQNKRTRGMKKLSESELDRQTVHGQVTLIPRLDRRLDYF